MKRADLIGLRFGKLVVDGAGTPDPSGRFRWRCKCDCGGEVSVNTDRLKQGKTSSCGCKPKGYIRDDSIIGKKFGCITITQLSHCGTHRDWFYFYRCDCGNEGTIRRQQLRKANGWKLGCPQCRWGDVGELTLAYFHSVEAGAKSRQIYFCITPEEAWAQFGKQNGKCALTGDPLTFARTYTRQQTASLDRIDSGLGYIPTNIQWVHKDINVLKWDFTTEELISLCRKVIKHHERISS